MPVNDLSLKYGKYFAEDAVQLLLNINGFYWLPKRTYHFKYFLNDMEIFYHYELPFGKAVEITTYEFESQIKEECEMIWKGVMATDNRKRKNEFYRRLLISVPNFPRRYSEKIFIFIALVGELCTNCYRSNLKHFIPLAIVVLQCFISRILQRVSVYGSLNISDYVMKFLRKYDDPNTVEEWNISKECYYHIN